MFKKASDLEVQKGIGRATAGTQSHVERELFEGNEDFERADLLPAQKDLFEHIQELEKGEVTDESIYQASERYYLATQQAIGEIDKKINSIQAEYLSNRDAARDALNLKRHELRYSVMNKREIEEEIDRYAEDPSSFGPDQADTLAATAHRIGANGLNGLKDIMKKAHSREPWRKGNEKLYKLRELYNSEFGQVKVLGPFGAEVVDIRKIFKGI